MADSGQSPRILVIRRDNIGDLVCTTPLITALRHQLPTAMISVLATRYNCAVIERHPDVDEVFSYTKAKHRLAHESRLGIYLDRARLLWRLARLRFDWVLLPGGPHASALRFARWIMPRRILVRGPEAAHAGAHEVEQACHLLTDMGLQFETPAPRVLPDAALADALRARMTAHFGHVPGSVVGLHISARRPAQRWSAERFAELARLLHRRHGCAFMLLWAPGAEAAAGHPGDDGKAAAVLAACADLPVFPAPTAELPELVAALSLCDRVICADGGAMHVAAGLGKPIVCLFGDSPADRWHPWGVPYQLLQQNPVMDIPAQAAADAFARLPTQP